MPDLPAEPQPVAWDSLLDEAIFEARRNLIGVPVTPNLDDAGYLASQWIDLGNLIISRQHLELDFEEWRDGHGTADD